MTEKQKFESGEGVITTVSVRGDGGLSRIKEGLLRVCEIVFFDTCNGVTIDVTKTPEGYTHNIKYGGVQFPFRIISEFQKTAERYADALIDSDSSKKGVTLEVSYNIFDPFGIKRLERYVSNKK